MAGQRACAASAAQQYMSAVLSLGARNSAAGSVTRGLRAPPQAALRVQNDMARQPPYLFKSKFCRVLHLDFVEIKNIQNILEIKKLL